MFRSDLLRSGLSRPLAIGAIGRRPRDAAVPAVIALAVVLAVLSYISVLYAAVLVAGLLLIASFVGWWPYAATGAMAAATAVTRYLFPIAGVNANAERILLPVIAVVVVVVTLVSKRSRPANGAGLGIPHIGLITLLMIMGFASAANAPDRSLSLRLTLLAATTSLPFLLLPAMIRNRRAIRFAFVAFVVLATLEACFGLVASGAFQLLHLNLGTQLDPITGGQAPYGTMWEGNIFGSFVGCGLVSLIAWSRSLRRHSFGLRLAWLGIAIMVVAVAASLSRGAWLGSLAGALTVLALMKGQKKTIIGVAVGIAVLAIVGATAGGAQSSPLIQRLSSLSTPQDGKLNATVQERLFTYQAALERWPQHPWIGWGTGALGEQMGYLSSPDVPAGISNLEIHALYDSGVLGLAGLVAAMGGTLLAAYRASRSAGLEPSDRALLVGLIGACVVLMVAYQATDAASLGYTWYVFGLAWTASALVRKRLLQIPNGGVGHLKTARLMHESMTGAESGVTSGAWLTE